MERGHTIKVLDNGYVKLIDFMGSDEAIVEDARMSTGKGFIGWGACIECQRCKLKFPKQTVSGYKCADGTEDHDWKDVPGDEKLLAHLYANRHTTPFETGGEMKIEVQAPLFVFREWHRHRTQCLRGSTEITCVSPRGTVFKRTIKEIYDLKYGGVIDQLPRSTKNGYSKAGTPVFRQSRFKSPTRTRILPNCQDRLLRVLDEGNETFTVAPMKDVWVSGMKEIFEVHTKNGHTIGASAQHPFYTREGWKKLKDLRPGDLLATNGLVPAMERPIPPSLRSGIGVWTSMMRSRLIEDRDVCYKCGKKFSFDDLDLDHVIPVILDLKKALDEENLKPICERCHRKKSNDEQQHRQAKTRLGVRWVALDSKPVCVSEEETYDIEVEGPHHNFIADGLVVHNSYNEFSARYAQMPDLHYVPELSRIQKQSATNKQGSGETLDAVVGGAIREDFKDEQRGIYARYDKLVEGGLAKEIARINTPVSRYSKMRAKTDLHNWLGFLRLRHHPAAQFEIQMYARAVAEMVKALWPRTWELFEEHDLGGVRLSRSEVQALRIYLNDGNSTAALRKKFGVK